MARALYREYVEQLHRFVPENEHEALLQSHAVATAKSIRGRLANTGQAAYTFGFTEPEALAFLQWWKRIPLPAGSLSQVTVQEIIGLIDRVNKNFKPLLVHNE